MENSCAPTLRTGESFTGSTKRVAVVDVVLNVPVTWSLTVVSTPIVPDTSPEVRSQATNENEMYPLKSLSGTKRMRFAPFGSELSTVAL